MTDEQMTVLIVAGLGFAVVAVLLLGNQAPAAHAMRPVAVPMATYQNAEEWQVQRDPRTQRILTIGVHRDARTGRAA